jgi:hypothetical protein
MLGIWVAMTTGDYWLFFYNNYGFYGLLRLIALAITTRPEASTP